MTEDALRDDADHHFIDIERLNTATLEQLLHRAESFLGPDQLRRHRRRLFGETIALLFYEPSTRTRISFELAGKRLGADTILFHDTVSSARKGESIPDTLQTLIAMGIRYFVIRHGENGIMSRLASNLPDGVSLINAGEGTRAHPTQALLDALTLRFHRPEFPLLTVAILGDIRHSRVARSTAFILEKLGIGALRLVAPPPFLPDSTDPMPGDRLSHIETGLAGADVVIALRVQWERLGEGEISISKSEYQHAYRLNRATFERLTKPDAILMHPGPVNWGMELDPDLIQHPGNLIREQVHNGVAVRMAVIDWLRESYFAQRAQ